MNKTIDIEEEKSNLYALIGGEEKLREMVDRFYDLMDLEPEFAGIRTMHPSSLEGSRDKLFWFLSGWMGGPDLFVQQFGHPKLRARHLTLRHRRKRKRPMATLHGMGNARCKH